MRTRASRPPRYRPKRRRTPLRVRIRHLLDEAGMHLSETFSELADWIRIGR